MAQTRVRAGGFAIVADIDGVERTQQAFRDVRSDISRRMRTIVRDAAEEVVLPAGKRAAARYSVEGQAVAPSLIIAKGVRKDAAFLTTRMRGRRGRVVGLLEFGGTTRAPIRPRKKQALYFGGRFAAKVVGPRRYEPRLFLSGARDRTLPEFGQTVRDRIVDEFAREGFEVT